MVGWLRQHLPVVGTLSVLAVAAVAALVTSQLPTPRGADAPAGDFSAERAVAHLDAIAARPHPTGSAASAGVRDHLVRELERLGMAVTAEPAVAASPSDKHGHVVGRVTNVHGVLRGTNSTGRVLLMAHYDSVPTGPGAADNGSNVASLLEVVRALRAAGTSRNDVEVLFTDGEEAGLLGARAFVARQPASDRRRTVVINLDARGTSGAALMFQTVGGSSRLTDTMTASGAAASSMTDEVFRRLPNYTDLTEFANAGFLGMNLAYVAGSAHYHTAHDDVAHLDRGSVQQMGDAVLAATRHLAASDLSQETAGRGEATYFGVYGWLVHYPGWLAVPLAVLAAAGYVLLLVWRRRAGDVTAGRVGLAALTFPLPLLLAGLVGAATWPLLTLLRPEYAQFLAGDPYRPGWYIAAELCLAAAGLVVWWRLLRRRCESDELTLSVLGWFAGLSLVAAVLLPGAAYLFTWPALLGCGALAAALRWAPPESGWRRVAGTGAATLTVVTLMLPVAAPLFQTLGVAAAAVPLLLVTVFGAAALGFVDLVRRPRQLTVAVVAAALAAPVLVTVGVVTDRYDSAHPYPVSLTYGVDADHNQAIWLASSDDMHPAVTSRAGRRPVDITDRFPNHHPGHTSAGDAGPAVTVPAPKLEELSDTASDGVRTIRFRLTAGAASVYRTGVYVDTSRHQVVSAVFDGVAVPGGTNLAIPVGDWRWATEYVGPVADGIIVELRVRGTGPLPVRVVDYRTGLPSGVPSPFGSQPVSPTLYPRLAGHTLVSRGLLL